MAGAGHHVANAFRQERQMSEVRRNAVVAGPVIHFGIVIPFDVAGDQEIAAEAAGPGFNVAKNYGGGPSGVGKIEFLPARGLAEGGFYARAGDDECRSEDARGGWNDLRDQRGLSV